MLYKTKESGFSDFTLVFDLYISFLQKNAFLQKKTEISDSVFYSEFENSDHFVALEISFLLISISVL